MPNGLPSNLNLPNTNGLPGLGNLQSGSGLPNTVKLPSYLGLQLPEGLFQSGGSSDSTSESEG